MINCHYCGKKNEESSQIACNYCYKVRLLRLPKCRDCKFKNEDFGGHTNTCGKCGGVSEYRKKIEDSDVERIAQKLLITFIRFNSITDKDAAVEYFYNYTKEILKEELQ